MERTFVPAIAICLSLTGACQEFDSRAGAGGPLSDDASSAAAGDDGGALCPPGSNPETSDLDPSGATIVCSHADSGIDTPVLIVELPILLPDGGTSTDPCESLSPVSVTIRRTYCASCHDNGPASAGNFSYIMDDAKLVTGISTGATPGLRMLIPGDPDHSWVYERVHQSLLDTPGVGMPPLLQGVPTSSQPPRPTAGDVAFLRGWIQDCLGPDPLAGDGGGAAAGGTAGEDAGAGGPAANDADPADAGALDGSVGGPDAGASRDAGRSG